MTKNAPVSIKSLNARAAADIPFEFEYVLPDGKLSGVFFSVVGSESTTFTAARNKLMNERRKMEEIAVIRARTGGRKDATVIPVEEDIEFGQKLTAARLVGWRGIAEPFSPDLALELIEGNSDIAAQINEHSNAAENFMKSSSLT